MKIGEIASYTPSIFDCTKKKLSPIVTNSFWSLLLSTGQIMIGSFRIWKTRNISLLKQPNENKNYSVYMRNDYLLLINEKLSV